MHLADGVGVQGVTRAVDVAAYNRTLQIGGAPPERLEEPLTQSQDIPGYVSRKRLARRARHKGNSDETDVGQSVVAMRKGRIAKRYHWLYRLGAIGSMPAGPLTPAENLVKAPPKCRAFFHSLALKYRNLLRAAPPKVRENPGKGLLLPCLERIGEGALAGQVAVDHGDIEPSPLLQQLQIAVLVRVHVRQTDHIESVVTFTASPASGTLRVCSPCFIRMPGTLRMPPAGKSVGSTATSGCGMTGLHGPAKRFRLSSKHGGRRIPDQNDDGAQMGTMRG